MFEPNKDRRRNWPRLITCALLGVVLAFGVGLHSASVVLERTAPQLAVQLNPSNGRALGRDAFQRFAARVEDPAEATKPNKEGAALEVLPLARKAIQLEPLNVQAHMIAASAAETGERRVELLEAALKLNRRSRALQTLSLQERTAAGDMDGSIETLDQILRVHPEASTEFFPVLSTVLANDTSLATFEKILVSAPPWQERFLLQAAGTKGSSKNASILTQRLQIDNEALNKALIGNLVREGELDMARRHYAFAYDQQASGSEGQSSAFLLAFPPFDWRMADEREMRAQLSQDGNEVELFVRPGNGGMLMNRIVQAKGNTLNVELEYDFGSSSQLENVRLQAACVDTQQAILDTPLAGQGTQFAVAKPQKECEYVTVGLYARVFRGDPAMRGTIAKFTVN